MNGETLATETPMAGSGATVRRSPCDPGAGRVPSHGPSPASRREDAGPQPLAGVVEEIGVEGQRAFRTLEDLGAILTAPARRAVGKPRSRRRKQPEG